MIIAIVPTAFRIPGKGEVDINQLEVRVSSYTLGVSAQAFYDLQKTETVEKTREVPNPDYVPAVSSEGGEETPAQGEPTITETYEEDVVTSYGLNGNDSLTEEQFANWGEDDVYFANCIAENLGLVPVTE
jgi:hypothetical protein